MLVRAYVWLIVRDICPCQFGLKRVCGWLDQQLLARQ